MDKLLVICGPTATGKTALAAALAKKFNGELISADSRQVYRGMDLVTGKDRPDVPIWLYDIVNPDEEFSVSHWVKLARAAIHDIQKRKKLPIIIGGTGLYIHALLDPFETIDIPPNKKLREELQKLSVLELQQMTTRDTMNNSDWNNPRRLVRKIEIAAGMKKNVQKETYYDPLLIGLTAPLPVLDARIDTRFQERVKQGMDKEAEALLKKYSKDLPSMSAIGLNEHAYARRQLTWFKKQQGIHWFDCASPSLLADVIYLIRHVPED
jgi:tRNA dimethylallyltransferase